MKKIKKELSLIIIMTFFFQNAALCLPDGNSALRIPLKFGKTAGSSEAEDLKLALDKTVMRRRLEELRKMVDVKLEEFDRAAASPEEKLDRERAIKRIENVFTIGELLIGFDAELFKQYINEVAEPLLKLDVRSVNFILASRVGYNFRAMSRLTKNYPLVIAQNHIKFMIERKKSWGNLFLPIKRLNSLPRLHSLGKKVEISI
jgi:hypothetical protein